jgi:hypothetical protein
MRVIFLHCNLKLLPDGYLELFSFLSYLILNDELLGLRYLYAVALLDLHLLAVVDLQNQFALDFLEDFGSECCDVDVNDQRCVHDCSAFTVRDGVDVLDLQPHVVWYHQIHLSPISIRVI